MPLNRKPETPVDIPTSLSATGSDPFAGLFRRRDQGGTEGPSPRSRWSRLDQFDDRGLNDTIR